MPGCVLNAVVHLSVKGMGVILVLGKISNWIGTMAKFLFSD